jgi:hypothetical protein
MMQRPISIAVVLGAVIIAVALVYHGCQLAEVSRRLGAMEQRTSGLDSRLEKFSRELPTLVEQAGNNAGRQAVHGMVDEVVQMPLNWLRPKLAPATSNIPKQTASAPHTNGPVIDLGGPWVRFDIRDPVIKIEILPNLKEVPAIPWPATELRKQAATQTNHAGSSELGPLPSAKAR